MRRLRRDRRFAPTGGHQEADLVLVGRASVECGHDAAAIHDRDPVGKLEHLVELCRDEQDGRPCVAFFDGLPMDELDAPDIEAARRLVEERSLRSRLNSRATTIFCWLPPESVLAATDAEGVRMS